VARPMPRAEPVMIALFPSSSPKLIPPVGEWGRDSYPNL
jgi:hypothetical protein